jgi:hypothetical protein
MAIHAMMRRITGGDWSRPSSTPDEDLADLDGHDAKFAARQAVSYTILDSAETRCLGCVDVTPCTDVMRRASLPDEEIARTGSACLRNRS